MIDARLTKMKTTTTVRAEMVPESEKVGVIL